jgi:hypothetical protein
MGGAGVEPVVSRAGADRSAEYSVRKLGTGIFSISTVFVGSA